MDSEEGASRPLIVFSNPGEMDIRGLTVMGLSAKARLGAIGRFGTGMKYAVAGALRLGGHITIISGFRVYSFGTRLEEMRGQEFEQVMITASEGGETAGPLALAFTTNLGEHWEAWEVLRELWANSRDEGGQGPASMFEWPTPKAGWTYVVLEGEAFSEALAQWGDYFLPEAVDPLWETEGLQCFPGPSEYGFYQGVRVVKLARPGAFTYNLLGHRDLTEDRTMPEYEFASVLTEEVMRARTLPPAIVNEVLRPKPEGWENGLYWPGWVTPGDGVMTIAGREALGIDQQDVSFLRPLSDRFQAVLAVHFPKPVGRTRFDELDEESPVKPDYTCQDINDLQRRALELVHYLFEEGKDWAAKELDQLVSDRPQLSGEKSGLELLREENQALRSCAVWWREVAKGMLKGVPARKAGEALEVL